MNSKWHTSTRKGKDQTTPEKKGEDQIRPEDILKLPLFTTSSDSRGHSISVGTRLPARRVRIIDEQVASNDTPYKTRSDYVRDALFTHAHIVAIRYLDGEAAAESQRLLAIERNRQHLANRIQLRAEAREYAMQIAALCRTGVEEDLDEAASSVNGQVVAVSEDAYAKLHYVGFLRQVGADRLLTDRLRPEVLSIIGQAKPLSDYTYAGPPALPPAG